MTSEAQNHTIFTCLRCGAVSHNPNDAAERYCGRCHAFEDRPSDAELARQTAKLSDAERLARAVLLFHNAPFWEVEQRQAWKALTGYDNATTRALCNLARRFISQEETATNA